MSRTFNETLIALVRSKPELWDPQLRNGRNQELAKRSWEEIGVVLNSSVEHVKTRWRSIRDRFVKEKKTNSTKITASGSKKVGKWRLWEQLMFLDPYLEPRTTNYTPPMLLNMLGMDDQESIKYEITITSGTDEGSENDDDPGSADPGSGTTQLSSASTAAPSRKRRQEQPNECQALEPEILQELPSSSAAKEYTAEELFYLSFAKDTANLGLAARLRIRQKCLEALATEVERQMPDARNRSQVRDFVCDWDEAKVDIPGFRKIRPRPPIRKSTRGNWP